MLPERAMKSAAVLTGSLIGLMTGISVCAQEATVIPPSFYAPEPPLIMAVLRNSESAKFFAQVLQAAGLGRTDVGASYVSFLVPRDSTCSDGDRAYLEVAKNQGIAARYIYDHAFLGQLAIYTENQRLVSVNYFPRMASMEGKVTIDEGHPFSMPLLSGRSVLISIAGGVIHVGSKSRVLDNMNTGDGGKLELDECAMF